MTGRKLIASAALGSLALGPLAIAACAAPPSPPRPIFRAGAPQAAGGSPRQAPAPKGALRVPILLYHHVGPVEGTWKNLYVSLPSFARQMRAIARSGVAMLTIDELYEAVRTGRSFPRGAVAITFDDATVDQYVLAFPIMRQYGIRATLFVPAGLVGKRGYLTWRQLKEMRESGFVDVESHTLTHADLTKLTPERAREEIAGGRAILERRLGAPVRHFAYPYGTYTVEILALVRAAGFRSALTNRFGEDRRFDDALEWGRMGVHDRYDPENLASIMLTAGRWRS